MFKLSVKRILEKLGKLNNLNPLTYMINGRKNKKLNFALFWPRVLGQTSQHWGRKNSNFSNFYWVISVSLTLYFQAWPGLTSCIIVLKEFISVFNNKAEKSTLSLFMVTVAKRNKMTHQYQESCRSKLPLKKLSWLDEYWARGKVATPKSLYL